MHIATLAYGPRRCRSVVTQLPRRDVQPFDIATTTEATAMNDSKNSTRYTGLDRRAPRSQPGMPAPVAGKQGAAVAREAYKTGGRHAAITNSLYNWHSYKNWADKMKGSWDEKK